MAHEEYTGMSAGTEITYDAGNAPTGWYQITITETGKPLPAQIDKTHAGDSAYAFLDDPLGGDGAPSCQVLVEGYMSITDHQDSGLLSKTFEGTGTVVVTKKSGADKFTATNARYSGMQTGGSGFGNIQPYTATFDLEGSAGAWTAS